MYDDDDDVRWLPVYHIKKEYKLMLPYMAAFTRYAIRTQKSQNILLRFEL